MASQVLSIFLVKKGCEDAILEGSRSPTATPIQVGAINGVLYTEATPLRPPSWVEFLTPGIASGVLNLETASASAVLVVPMVNRTFAVTFGYGRHLINPMSVEPTFGLKATLNAISPDRIRSIDKKTFEGISTHTQEQASKDTSIGDFGVDVERDVVRAVTGTPSDETLAHRMKGMDSLVATCDATLQTLPEFLQAYFAKSEEDRYRSRFAWIDNILEVRDKARREMLDTALIEALRAGGSAKMWLAIPDLIDWSDVSGFTYSRAPSAARVQDIHFKTYFGTRKRETCSIEALKRHRVYGWRATNDTPVGPWPVYRCIHAELEIDGETFLLNAGEWYRIDKDFVSLVDDSIRPIQPSKFISLDYTEGEGEARYNQRLSKAIPGACCLDAKMIQYGGGKSSVEFCDVYHPSGHMIHVKRYAGSTVLSHLFAQGTVSATAFISDDRFRREVNKRLPPALRIKNPAARPSVADLEVAFVIASRSASALALPFFSRVTLRNTYTQLTNYGFRTTLTKVGTVESEPA